MFNVFYFSLCFCWQIPSLFFCFLDILLLVAIQHPDYILFEDVETWNHFVNSFANLNQPGLVVAILLIRILIRVVMIFSIPCAVYGNFYNRLKYIAPYKYLVISSILFIMITGTYFSIVYAKVFCDAKRFYHFLLEKGI